MCSPNYWFSLIYLIISVGIFSCQTDQTKDISNPPTYAASYLINGNNQGTNGAFFKTGNIIRISADSAVIYDVFRGRNRGTYLYQNGVIQFSPDEAWAIEVPQGSSADKIIFTTPLTDTQKKEVSIIRENAVIEHPQNGCSYTLHQNEALRLILENCPTKGRPEYRIYGTDWRIEHFDFGSVLAFHKQDRGTAYLLQLPAAAGQLLAIDEADMRGFTDTLRLLPEKDNLPPSRLDTAIQLAMEPEAFTLINPTLGRRSPGRMYSDYQKFRTALGLYKEEVETLSLQKRGDTLALLQAGEPLLSGKMIPLSPLPVFYLASYPGQLFAYQKEGDHLSITTQVQIGRAADLTASSSTNISSEELARLVEEVIQTYRVTLQFIIN
ncbi:MAG: hypothetical protein AAF828_00040 [Bacteroidota bacterium]